LRLRKRIQTIFRLPSLVGVSAIALALFEDCEKCGTTILIAPEWVSALRQVATETTQEIASTFSLDAAKLGALNSRVVNAGVGKPTPKLNKSEQLQIVSCRLQLMLFALATGERGPFFWTDKLMLLYQLIRSPHETYPPSHIHG
jgi:hypothetical protein